MDNMSKIIFVVVAIGLGLVLYYGPVDKGSSQENLNDIYELAERVRF